MHSNPLRAGLPFLLYFVIPPTAPWASAFHSPLSLSLSVHPSLCLSDQTAMSFSSLFNCSSGVQFCFRSQKVLSWRNGGHHFSLFFLSDGLLPPVAARWLLYPRFVLKPLPSGPSPPLLSLASVALVPKVLEGSGRGTGYYPLRRFLFFTHRSAFIHNRLGRSRICL